MKRIIIIVIILSIVGIKIFVSQKNLKAEDSLCNPCYEPPNKISVKVEPEVIFEGEKVKYIYTIISDKNSIQDVWTFDLEVDEKIFNIKMPKGWYGEFDETAFLFCKDEPTPIFSCNASGEEANKYFIKPGTSLSGFSFSSYGLPSIKNAYLEGYTEPAYYPDGMPEEADEIEPCWPEDSMKVKTIGPIPPPAIFEPVSFINHIILLKEEAFRLGWINNKGIANSLNSKLNNAKDALKRGNNNAGKNIINAFINELDAQKEKHIDSNAYYLLKINAEYLLNKI